MMQKAIKIFFIPSLFIVGPADIQAESLPTMAASVSGPTSGPSTPADPCQYESKWREYNVSAIDVKMVLNRFGDRDDDAFMFVLDEKIKKIEDWQNQPGCTSWDNPGGHIPCVSTGLRDDLVQPLVLRANLGQCLVIHFTNRLSERKWPIDRTPDGQPISKASIQIDGLAYSVERGGEPVTLATFAAENETITYKIPLPGDPAAERAYRFHDAGGNRQRVPHGLFGVIVAEPAGSKYLDPKTGYPSDGTGWEAIIEDPERRDFREFVIIYHEWTPP